MRVLIVDDSALMRKIVGKALREAVLELDEVVEAANGVEGVAALARQAEDGERIDLVLCDLHMPALDGVGFLREIAARGLDAVPVVVVTADAGDPLVQQALATGARGFIAKPFTAERMREQLAVFAETA